MGRSTRPLRLRAAQEVRHHRVAGHRPPGPPNFDFAVRAARTALRGLAELYAGLEGDRGRGGQPKLAAAVAKKRKPKRH